ncbi:MAG: porin family protein [Hyphomicrobiaceae bacterium]|nr:porin family protein [Hyphomicrobiaceae bacterium]
MSKFSIKSALAALALTAVCAPAMAADLGGYRAEVEPADTSPPVRLNSWRGFYVGVNGGYAWGSGDPTIVSDGINSATLDAIDPSGFLGGGQIGYNAQFGNFVIGAEADFQGGWVDGSSSGVTGIGAFSTSSDLNWLSTVRGRVGFAGDRVLVYATGGVAWADMNFRASDGVNTIGGGDTLTGYAVGGGVEWMLDPNWTARAEYLYVDLEDAKIAAGGGGSATFDNAFHIMRVGLNYKF